MARKITDDAVKAFFEGRDFKRDNTEVSAGDYVVMFLHGNTIATRDYDTGEVRISLAGYPTLTTRERLNGLLDYLGQPRLFQHKGQTYQGTVESPRSLDKPFPTRGFVTVREGT